MSNRERALSSDQILAQRINEENKRLSSAALRLSRKQQLEALIIKRKANFAYLKKVHDGDAYWLNSAFLSRDFMRRYSQDVPTQRTVGYFYLGLGIANVLKKLRGVPIAKAFSQLIEEFEYFNSSAAMQSMKYMIAKSSSTPYCPHGVFTPGSETESGEPGKTFSHLYKFNSDVLYEFLSTPAIPFDLNYLEVVGSLAEMLSDLYQNLLHEDSYRFSIIEFIIHFSVRLNIHK